MSAPSVVSRQSSLQPDFAVELDVQVELAYRQRHRGREGFVALELALGNRLLHRFLDGELGVDAHGLEELADAHIQRFVVHVFLLRFLKWLISPLVDASCVETAPAAPSSGRMRPARVLPSSTPHWSKGLMSQITLCTNTLCS